MTALTLPTWATEIGATVYLTSDRINGSRTSVSGPAAKIIKVSAAGTQVTVQRTEKWYSNGTASEIVKTYRFKASDSWRDSTKMKQVAGEKYSELGLVSESDGAALMASAKREKEIGSLRGTAAAIAKRLADTRYIHPSDIATAIEQLQEVHTELARLES